MQRALLVAGLLLIGCGSPTGRSIEADGAIAIDSRIVVANDSAVADFVLTDGDPEDDALLGDAAPADAAAADARSADATLVRDARSDAAAASCQVNHGGCSDNADCLPGSNGGVQCVCISGYAGDGWSCKASQSVQVLEV
ncbi:MAG: hypothetical protein KDA89_25700, partial [Planctomycetaceae bacterium]|nr:hypothetical protein [Planctomycetaceae bacterium]